MITFRGMEAAELVKYLTVFEKDSRLTAWHVSLLYAIIALAIKQGKRRAIRVSRSRIMALSHITTLPTYHKYFKDLQVLGYINYRPSYHPGFRSEVDLKAI
jgi:hypothetical protein